MKLFWYIERMVIAALLLLLLALAPAKAQNVVNQGETITLGIEQKPGETYQWELYRDSTVNFAVTDGDISPIAYAEFVDGSDGPSVNVKWKIPGTYFYKVTALDAAGCAMNLKIGIMKVKTGKPTAVITPPNPDGICIGQSLNLEINFTGTGPWEFIFTDGLKEETLRTSDNPYIKKVHPTESTQYWITGVKDKFGNSNDESWDPGRISIHVYPKPKSSKIYLKKAN